MEIRSNSRASIFRSAYSTTFDKAISFGGISNSNKIADSSDDDRKFLYYKNDTCTFYIFK